MVLANYVSFSPSSCRWCCRPQGVVSILTFNLTWNSYLWPLIVASDDALRTLPLGMAAFQAGFNTQYGEVMAVSVFGALPTALFFLSLQRYFVEGAVASGVK